METQTYIDKAYVLQCIDKVEELLSINAENTSREIQKLTETMTREEQQLFADEWSTIYHFDCSADELNLKNLITKFFLYKLSGD